MIDRSRIGEEIIVALSSKRSDVRTLTDIRTNVEGDPFFVWTSRSSEGACVPDLWDRWKNGEVSYED